MSYGPFSTCLGQLPVSTWLLKTSFPELQISVLSTCAAIQKMPVNYHHHPRSSEKLLISWCINASAFWSLEWDNSEAWCVLHHFPELPCMITYQPTTVVPGLTAQYLLTAFISFITIPLPYRYYLQFPNKPLSFKSLSQSLIPWLSLAQSTKKPEWVRILTKVFLLLCLIMICITNLWFLNHSLIRTY